MKKLLVLMLTVVCLLSLSVMVLAKDEIKIGMVTDVGGLGDQSFNDAAYRGLKWLEEEFGVKVTVVESAMMTDYVVNLSSLAEQGYDLVWAIGFLMQDALAEVAELYPDTRFGLIDSVVDAPNVASVTFKEHEGSFLVGVLAGLKTKTNKVGFIGGMDFPLIHKFEAGFIAGVKTVNPDAEVIVGYTGVFDDPNKGKELALTQYSQGADIIYHASGACGIGVIKAAEEKGPEYFAIGVDSPQFHLAPDSVLTSMLKRVDVGVYTVSKALIKGEWKAGHIVLGLAENGVGYSEHAKKMFDKDTLDIVEGYKMQIIAGEIKVPSTREELKEMFGN
ncbi:BMP family ABC transporter substrate-binding protein [Anoxybacter fermentans]|uniref:BMP family ABC transporter substrate-binding protein n=1 Tax=Anoxybacter fermentans TaxID=1323375 RepID=A0A3Q9HRJ7_9FIRM|nr:BMP family ABC transporter substrate-binding protein [Anoxybacter fermentans]AZR74133.1 BMP family ABC transporter substrate-binding protein [Anoxybacter fermentans]